MPVMNGFGMLLASVFASLSGTPQVDIKVYENERPLLLATVPVNAPVELAGASGLRVAGEIGLPIGSYEVTYELVVASPSGRSGQSSLTVPFETCAQRIVELEVRYIVRLCGDSGLVGTTS